MNVHRDHLIVRCDFFDGLWSLLANWLGFEIVCHKFLYEHLVHFGALDG